MNNSDRKHEPKSDTLISIRICRQEEEEEDHATNDILLGRICEQEDENIQDILCD